MRLRTSRLCVSVLVGGAIVAGVSSSSSANPRSATRAVVATAASAGVAKGSPVVIDGETALSGQLQTYPLFPVAMKAAAAAINKNGGINGHRIEISMCDDQSDPNVASSCAHKDATGNAIADVMHSNFDAANAPILKAGGLAQLTSGGNAGDYTNPITFPLDPGSIGAYVGTPLGLKKLGKSKLAVVAVDVAAATNNISVIQKAAKAAGITYAGSVVFPLTATDYSPYALKLKQLGADSALMITAFSEASGFIKAAAQLGLTNVRWVFPGATTGQAEIDQLGSAKADALVVGDWPPYGVRTIPAVKQFDTEMASAGHSPKRNPTTQVEFAAWLSVNVIADVADQVKGRLNKKTFLAKLRKTKSVNALGLFKWHPDATGTVPSEPRLTNGNVYYEVTNSSGQLGLLPSLPKANIFSYFK